VRVISAFPGLFTGLLLLMATGCSEEEATTVPAVCDPEVFDAQAIDPGNPDPGANTPSPLTVEGGTLRIYGRHLWPFFSSDDVDATPTDATPTDATPLEETPTEDDTPSPAPEPYPFLYNLAVWVGSQRAEVTGAFEQSVRPAVTYIDLTTGETVVSDCPQCRSCLDAQADAEGTSTSSDCGGCDQACMGCQQVVEVVVPELLTTPGDLLEQGTVLSVPLYVFSGRGQAPGFSYYFSTLCGDGVDNDGDGWIDDEDPGCQDPSTLSAELDACADGVDNEGDGTIDLEDEDCAGDPLGQSEETTLAAPRCANGLDDDQDGLIDQADLQCATGLDDDESTP